jgi:hypothetical protein
MAKFLTDTMQNYLEANGWVFDGSNMFFKNGHQINIIDKSVSTSNSIEYDYIQIYVSKNGTINDTAFAGSYSMLPALDEEYPLVTFFIKQPDNSLQSKSDSKDENSNI